MKSHQELKEPPRVLFVESYPQGMYGQQKTLSAILKHMKQEAVTPVVAVPFKGTAGKVFQQQSVAVEVIPYPALLKTYGGAIYDYNTAKKAVMYGQLLKYIYRLRKWLLKQNFQLVYCNDMRGIMTVGIAGRLAGLPVVTWDKLDKPHGWMDAVELPLLNEVFIISEAVKNKFPGWQLSRFKNKITLIRNGINIEHFQNGHFIRGELGFNKEDILIGTVGTICRRKGQDRILQIMNDLTEKNNSVHYLVVGTAAGEADEDYLKTLPCKDNSNVHFLGRREDMPNMMHTLDILAAPSRSEGMGRVIVEAMAAGTPVVGANAGGIKEVILHDKTGFLFEGDNKEELKKQLLGLIKDKQLREKLGAAGKIRSENYFNEKKQIGKIVAKLMRYL
jgi:glycosyltransferase involved in cell wall biosynthesis